MKLVEGENVKYRTATFAASANSNPATPEKPSPPPSVTAEPVSESGDPSESTPSATSYLTPRVILAITVGIQLVLFVLPLIGFVFENEHKQDFFELLGLLLATELLGVLYFLPTYMSLALKARRYKTIFLINLIFGITCFGYLLSMQLALLELIRRPKLERWFMPKVNRLNSILEFVNPRLEQINRRLTNAYDNKDVSDNLTEMFFGKFEKPNPDKAEEEELPH